MSPGLALITGASSGIGAELARIHAARGGDLVIVARRKDRLDALKAELEAACGVSVRVLAVDLTDPDGPEQILAATPMIDILINNAGFGLMGALKDQDRDRLGKMIALNVGALTALTRGYVPRMLAAGHGRILNVSSTAGFLPGPGMAVYFATKAYVNAFSQALTAELRGTGVTVSAICPGPVRTEFGAVAGMEGSRLLESAVSPAHTAKVGYDAMLRGQALAFDNWLLRLALGWVVPLLPRRLVLWASGRALRKL